MNLDVDIRSRMLGTGMGNIEQMGEKLAKNIESTDSMNQVDLIKLQQEMASYTNTISMMSTMLKSLSDTDKEVIRAI